MASSWGLAEVVGHQKWRMRGVRILDALSQLVEARRAALVPVSRGTQFEVVQCRTENRQVARVETDHQEIVVESADGPWNYSDSGQPSAR